MGTPSVQSVNTGDGLLSQDSAPAHGAPERMPPNELGRSRKDKFLTVFAVAAIMTVPSALLVLAGSVFDLRLALQVGVVMLLIAGVVWWVAYLLVVWWILRDVLDFFPNWLSRRRSH